MAPSVADGHRDWSPGCSTTLLGDRQTAVVPCQGEGQASLLQRWARCQVVVDDRAAPGPAGLQCLRSQRAIRAGPRGRRLLLVDARKVDPLVWDTTELPTDHGARPYGPGAAASHVARAIWWPQDRDREGVPAVSVCARSPSCSGAVTTLRAGGEALRLRAVSGTCEAEKARLPIRSPASRQQGARASSPPVVHRPAGGSRDGDPPRR